MALVMLLFLFSDLQDGSSLTLKLNFALAFNTLDELVPVYFSTFISYHSTKT